MKKLTPFKQTSQTQNFLVEANLSIHNSQVLVAEFKISGPVKMISWPMENSDDLNTKDRQDELWKTTCLETFFSSGIHKEDPYTEINCSPNGHWNAYTFNSYREGMMRSADISVQLKQKQTTELTAYFLFEIQSQSAMNVESFSLTMVMEFADGEKSYWAMRHPGPTADFHNKEGWN
ncbi:MAG: DOMON-like domain-containing protein [Pseudobdellovibrionaceae bacterium]